MIVELVGICRFAPDQYAKAVAPVEESRILDLLVNANAVEPQCLDQLDFTSNRRVAWRRQMRPAVHASVLIPLVMRDQGLTVLLTERTTHLSSHSGQIAFPGGKADPDDSSAVDTALREAQEEIGLDREFVEVLGTLPIYTTGSAFIVTPVVALVRAEHVVTANPHEVADVFEVPLDFLMDPANHRRHAVEWAGARREWLSMPYTDTRAERFIWGATAGMLRNFYRFLLD